MKYTILYVEDDRDFAELIIEQLKENDYNVIHECCGKTFLKKYQTFSPDIILLDVLLPDFDGFTVAGIIRESDPFIPILMLTSLTRPVDEIKGLRIGVNDYIHKETDFDVLLARIEKELKKCPKNNPLLKLSEITFVETNTKTLICAGIRWPLGMREFDLLWFFCHNLNTLHDRTVIQQAIWGRNSNAKQYLYKTTSLLKEFLINDPSLSIQSFRKGGIGLMCKLYSDIP